MHVAVFGAAGFVGRALLRRLDQQGLASTAIDVVPDPFGGSRPYVQADVLDRPRIEQALRGCNAVVHLAAHSLTASLADPRTNAKVNVEGSLSIFDAARAQGISRIVFSSASSLYGTPRYNPVDEEHSVDPQTPYGVAKFAVEQYLRVYERLFKIEPVVFRFFNVYGPGQTPQSGALIPVVLDKVRRGEPVTIFGDGSAARDFIFVEDVAEMLVRAATGPSRTGVYNLGTGRLATVQEVVDLCAKVAGRPAVVERKPPRPGEITNFSADTRKLHKTFGELPFLPLEEGLRRTAAAQP